MRLDLKFGLIIGAGVSAWILGEFLLGFHTTRLEIGEYSGYFSSLVPLAGLFVMLRRLRDASPTGRLSVIPALWYGVIASTVAALVVYAFLVLYNQVINPDWLQHALEWKTARMRAAGMAEADIRQELNFYRNMNSPFGLLLSTLAGYMLMGAFISLLLAVVLRRKQT